MTGSWAYEGAPGASHSAALVTLVEGSAFCISEPTGDVRPGSEQGFYFRDTRHLSRFELELDGEPAEPLSLRRLGPFGSTFIARRVPRPGRADSTLLVLRSRYVGDGMVEEIVLRNFGPEPAALLLTLRVESDLASLFQVKEGRPGESEAIAEVAGDRLWFRRQRGGESRSSAVTATGDALLSLSLITWSVVVPARGEWGASVQVSPRVDGQEIAPRYEVSSPVEKSLPATSLAAWRKSAPQLRSRDGSLDALFAQSLEDLASLRLYDPEDPTRRAVAAGVPWFMTLFGRDSLLASWMLLPIDPALALGTMQMLGEMQGKRVEPRSEEEPGRILHEVRGGLDTSLALGGSAYYGSIDSTLLFVMLLGEMARWGVDMSQLEELLPFADAALSWAESYGDRDGDGFVEYRRATDQGLANQGWKDSFDAISFASGRLADPPIALVEVQGYAYAAYRARAALARQTGDESRARECDERASELRARFDEHFWLEDLGYFALGLDADKKPIDALASNMGHCLWAGIVEPARARQVARLLVGPELFSGFGVRTLGASMGAYNPMSYHNGSVWPHDNALAAAGLMRYGHVREAQRVADAVFDAARCFGGRLPELYCGFDRTEFDEPVPYPTSCYPQAWAAASPLLLLRALLRLEPDLPAGRVSCEPAVPPHFLPLKVEHLNLAGHLATAEVERTGWSLSGLPAGIRLERTARLATPAAG